MSPYSVQLIPLDFLLTIANPNPKEFTDDGTGYALVYFNRTIWKQIKSEGMYDPFYITMLTPSSFDCDTGTYIRLESGNQRIHCAIEDGVTHMPVVTIFQKYPIFNEGNGKHKFIIDKSKARQFYDEIGRPHKRYDPYPHPVDFKKIYPELDIFYIPDIKEITESGGILEFKPGNSR
jgi:hypothetical protein